MSITLIETLMADGDTPSGAYLRNIAGVSPAGKTKPVLLGADSGLQVMPSEATRTSFSRMRTALIEPVFDCKQVYEKETFLMVESLTGAGATSTFNANHACVDMALTTAVGKVVRQSRYYIPYQPGRTNLSYLSVVFNSAKTNLRQRVGAFDDNNGLFVELSGSTLSVVHRTKTSGSVVDNSVAQASWNLDKLDGTGVSGITLDMAKLQVVVIDFSWLGAGAMRIGFLIEGQIVYAHKFKASNTLSLPWSSNPAFPLRYEIEHTGVAASASTLKQICCASFSEGGFDPLGIIASGDNGTTSRSVTTGATTPVIAFRLKSAYARALIVPIAMTVITEGNQNLYWSLCLNSTFGTAGAWVSNSQAVEENVTAGTATGGRVLRSGYVSSVGHLETTLFSGELYAASDFAGTPDVLSINVISLGGGANVRCAMGYKEIY